jgi:hypothetical protein
MTSSFVGHSDGPTLTPEEARDAVLAGQTVRMSVDSGDPEDPVCLLYVDRCSEFDGEPNVYSEAIDGWSAGVKEAVCELDSSFFLEFVADDGRRLELTDQEPPLRETPVDAPGYGLCADCAGVRDFLSQYTSDELSDAARHIAFGLANGGWCCDHVEWDHQDAYAAATALWGIETRRRDRLREALDQIGEHARLDEAERGFGEASRYYAIAEDAIAKAGLPPAAYLGALGQEHPSDG